MTTRKLTEEKQTSLDNQRVISTGGIINKKVVFGIFLREPDKVVLVGKCFTVSEILNAVLSRHWQLTLKATLFNHSVYCYRLGVRDILFGKITSVRNVYALRHTISDLFVEFLNEGWRPVSTSNFNKTTDLSMLLFEESSKHIGEVMSIGFYPPFFLHVQDAPVPTERAENNLIQTVRNCLDCYGVYQADEVNDSNIRSIVHVFELNFNIYKDPRLARKILLEIVDVITKVDMGTKMDSGKGGWKNLASVNLMHAMETIFFYRDLRSRACLPTLKLKNDDLYSTSIYSDLLLRNSGNRRLSQITEIGHSKYTQQKNTEITDFYEKFAVVLPYSSNRAFIIGPSSMVSGLFDVLNANWPLGVIKTNNEFDFKIRLFEKEYSYLKTDVKFNGYPWFTFSLVQSSLTVNLYMQIYKFMQVKNYELVSTFQPENANSSAILKDEMERSGDKKLKKFVPKMRFVEKLMPVKIGLHAWLYGVKDCDTE